MRGNTGNTPQASHHIAKIQDLLKRRSYVDCERQARNVLKQYPTLGIAWMFLGLALRYQGRTSEALLPLQRAAKLLPNDANAQSNYGALLGDIGNVGEAETAYRAALKISPRSPEVLGNLGAVLKAQGKVSDAAETYRQAIAIAPAFADGHNNLGNILFEAGELEKAIMSYLCAIQIEPTRSLYYLNLGDAYRYADNIEEELTAYQNVLRLDKRLGLIAAIWLAIRYYQQGSLDKVTDMLLSSKPIMATTEQHLEPHRIYWNYLAILLRWQAQNLNSSNLASASTPIYVVGESHSLATHGTIVKYRGVPHRCIAKWIAGCKQWHFANAESNKYKCALKKVINKIPPKTAVLFTIGEIDCRLNEGILRHLARNSAALQENVIESTVVGYLDFLATICGDLDVTVCGVPAINIPLELVGQQDAERLSALIVRFNQVLQEQALSRNMGFLDVYALTNRGDGFSTGEYHLDRYHLSPSAIATAFSHHLRRPPKILQ